MNKDDIGRLYAEAMAKSLTTTARHAYYDSLGMPKVSDAPMRSDADVNVVWLRRIERETGHEIGIDDFCADCGCSLNDIAEGLAPRCVTAADNDAFFKDPQSYRHGTQDAIVALELLEWLILPPEDREGGFDIMGGNFSNAGAVLSEKNIEAMMERLLTQGSSWLYLEYPKDTASSLNPVVLDPERFYRQTDHLGALSDAARAERRLTVEDLAWVYSMDVSAKEMDNSVVTIKVTDEGHFWIVDDKGIT